MALSMARAALPRRTMRHANGLLTLAYESPAHAPLVAGVRLASTRQTSASKPQQRGVKLSNQVERAIRLKSQERAREKWRGSDDQRPTKPHRHARDSDSAKGVRERQLKPKHTAVRQIRFKTVQSLHDLLYTHDIDKIDAYNQAERIVEDLTPYQRRDQRIYTTLIRHAFRMQKAKRGLKILQDMKKNGVSPSMYAYFSIFLGAAKLRLSAQEQTRVVTEVQGLFPQAEKLWRSAFEEKKEADRAIARKGELSSGGEEDGIPSTAESFRLSAIEAQEALRKDPESFTQTCEAYLDLLLSVDKRDDAAAFVLRMDDLSEPAKRGQVKARGLALALARKFLLHNDVRIPEGQVREETIRSALRLASQAVERQSSGNTLAQNRRSLTSSVKGDGTSSLALTDNDLREIMGNEFESDGPPGSKPYV